MHRYHTLAAVLAAISVLPAHASERCFDFSGLKPGTTHAVNAPEPIEIGE